MYELSLTLKLHYHRDDLYAAVNFVYRTLDTAVSIPPDVTEAIAVKKPTK